MAYRFTIDSTKRTLARYPGAHDVLMDEATGHAAALCLHYETPICQGAFSWAPAIQEALELASRQPFWLTPEESQKVVNALNGAGEFGLAGEIGALRKAAGK